MGAAAASSRASRRGSEHRHPRLRGGPELDRLDPVGHELGARVTAASSRSGLRREARAVGSDVGLVARALRPGRRRRSGSRRPPRRPRAVERATCSTPRGTSARDRLERTRRSRPGSTRCRWDRRKRPRHPPAPPSGFRGRDDGADRSERLGNRDPEALVQRCVDEAPGSAVQRPSSSSPTSPSQVDVRAAARRSPSRARRRREARRPPPRRSGRGSCAARASRLRARIALRGGPSGVNTSSTAFGTTVILAAGTASRSSQLSRGEARKTAITLRLRGSRGAPLGGSRCASSVEPLGWRSTARS